jgi:hypothetical protein
LKHFFKAFLGKKCGIYVTNDELKRKSIFDKNNTDFYVPKIESGEVIPDSEVAETFDEGKR